MLERILYERQMSVYQCAKLSGIPYTTLLDIVRGKTDIGKCSAETVYRLASILNVVMEDLLRDTIEVRVDFEIFKSNVCHLVKDLSDIDYIIETLKADDVNRYWNKKWYPEAFYTLAMLDYLSRINDIPLCEKYNQIRMQSLSKPIYPKDVLLADKLDSKSKVKEQSFIDAIPEFVRFNIIESEIRNVY